MALPNRSKPRRKGREGDEGMKGKGSLQSDWWRGMESLSPPGLTLRLSSLLVSSYDSCLSPSLVSFSSVEERVSFPLSPLLVNRQERDQTHSLSLFPAIPPLIICLFVPSHTQHIYITREGERIITFFLVSYWLREKINQ